MNKSKCEFNKNSVEFFGYCFSAEGVSADPKKTDAIKSATSPQNAGELRSLLGLANYVSRFIPDFATIVAPLRTLTHQNTTWQWGKKEQSAFKELEEKLSSEVMAYFNPAKSTKLLVDASQVGLGAVLTQEGKIISYASKELSDVEKRYSQTEKEALTIVWGIEHFHLYLFGSEFILTTDHKPLEIIFNNPRSKPPARIERWRLRLQPYDFKVEYRPGKGNPADYLSRHPGQEVKTFRHSKIAEEYLNLIVSSSKPKALTIKQITDASNKDPVIQEVITRMLKAEWESSANDPCIRSYFVNRDKLTIAPTENGSILLFENRLVIPEHLQKTVVELAHEGHQGIVKTKQLLRDKVGFSGINQLVEEICKKCIPCAASTPTKHHEPLQMTEIPDEPWSRVSADICGPFQQEYLLVVIDDHSRYPVVEVLRSTSAISVIPLFDKIFSLFGIPEELKTDNGPPFQSFEFRQFAEQLGYKHHRITPLWPKANGEAERFMRTLGKAIRTAHIESKN